VIVESNLKFKILLLSLTLCVLCSQVLKAQKAYSFKTYYKVKERKNVLKIGLPALFFNNVHIKYQRSINKKFSFQLSWAKYFETDLVKRFEGKSYKFREYEADFAEFNQGEFYGSYVTVPQLKFTGFYTQAELRYQFSKKKLLTGFYIGPYCAYHLNVLNNISAYDDLGFKYTGQVDLSLFNTGAEMGYQWLIEKFLLVDFQFFGLGWSFAKHNLMFTTNNFNLKYDKIDKDLNNSLSTELDFDAEDFKTSTFQNGLKYNVKSNYPILRMGLSVGIVF